MVKNEPLRVIVTAGAGGIGRAIVERFLADGAQVATCDVDGAALETLCARHPDVATLKLDVTQADAAERLIALAMERMGGIDVLVNNVGIGGATLPVAELPREDWQRVLDVNLSATFAMTQAAIPHLIQSRGTIVIMSSAAGRYGYPNRSAYAVSKWGLVGFAKTLAMELGRHGISANAVLPGAVSGDRFDRVIDGRVAVSGKSREQVLAEATASQSLPQIASPEDVADLVAFLTTPAGRKISGAALPIDGDLQHG